MNQSEYTIVDHLEPGPWEEFVHKHPYGSIFQTPWMFQVYQETRNYHPSILAALDASGEILALLLATHVQTLSGPLARLASRSMSFAEPLARQDAQGEKALKALLAARDARVRTSVLFSEIRPLNVLDGERCCLEQAGFQYEDYVNYLIDLRRPSKELWAALTDNCRSNIRRGFKRGVRIEEMTTQQGVDILYDLVAISYAHAQVPLTDKSQFDAALRILAPRGMFKVFNAFLNDEPIGASVVLLYKERVYEWYWGVKRVKSVYPAECITWHRIEWGQQNGFAVYDFGGAGWPNKPYGVRDFKSKFGGELVSPGRYRKIYSPLKFALAERGFELARKLISPKN